MNKGRILSLRKQLSQLKVENFFVSNPINIFYLTGFKTLSPSEREAFLLLTKKNLYLLTDPRHDTQLKDESINIKLISSQKNLAHNLSEIISLEKIKTLGFEREDLKYSEHDYLRKKFKLKLKPLKKPITRLREIKSDDEVKKIAKACTVADQCLKEVIKWLKVGVSEREISFRIDFYFRKKGYESSFAPIVAFDKNAAIAHYDTQLGSGVLKKNSVVLIDFGAKSENYCSDMTRMFFMPGVSTEVVNVYAELLKAQEHTIAKIKDFKKTKQVDLFVRKLLQEQRFSTFPHSTGHGIGLEVHESPSISAKSKDSIAENQVFTVEPGIYFRGKWGMRTEDVVHIKNGRAEVLTGASKKAKILTL